VVEQQNVFLSFFSEKKNGCDVLRIFV